ncbi:TIM barrel protein [Vallitalea pronyensis]|uniref:TIM barrel protein n=1 Tax=Vallitalea pronyensis TaxID=1348613 RepID=A0A8J8MN92_9FIRM|nr:TIM barrel protein [Vallitalea pronyensis]QUI24624.1 TIM barrel protein [Vallitalea pronyensis]
MIHSIGIRASDFGKLESDQLAKIVRKNNLNSVQLPLHKAIKGIDSISDYIAKETLQMIANHFKRECVSIAVLGCYLNYAHPNKRIREQHLETFKNHIAYANDLDARVIGTETGSVLADYAFHPDNHTKEAYLVFARSLEALLIEAQEKEVTIAIEGVADHIIHSNKKMKQIIKDMQSKYVKVILDPVNLLTSDNYLMQESVLKEAFDLFGDDVLIVHSKDFRVQENKIIETYHGTGDYNFSYLVEAVSSSSQSIDILLENTNVKDLENILTLFQ